MANGGGYSFGAEFSGSVAPFQPSGTEYVAILEEDLQIELRRGVSFVTVRYKMQNQSSKSRKVRFGFPAESIRSDLMSLEPVPSPNPFEKDLRNYEISLNGKAIESEYLPSEKVWSGKEFPGAEALKGVQGWQVSEVRFPKSDVVELEIRFQCVHSSQWRTSSDDVHRGAEWFRYRLSTGAVWRGPIQKGKVEIRAVGVPAAEVVIESPLETFLKDPEGVWRWEFQQLEPSLADDIAIQVCPGFYSPWGPYLLRQGRWSEHVGEVSVSASSTLSSEEEGRYAASRVFERQGVWSEGAEGSGVGEWLEFTLEEPSVLEGLWIRPGFQTWQRPELFRDNARPARLDLVLDEEHVVDASLPDLSESYFLPILDWRKPVKSVRLIVREVYPGKRFPDLCISQVVLYRSLAKEPVYQQAR